MNDEELLELKRPFIEACIKSAKKNGWSDAIGILRGTLFLESEPMSLDMLAEKTGYSKTTVRYNMNCLENLGLVTRVVGPLGGYRSKQHRYALVTDTEAMKAVVMSTAKGEIHSVLQALHQIEKNLENQSPKAEEMTTTMVRTRQFYEEMNKILDLMNKYTMKELIELLDRNKK